MVTATTALDVGRCIVLYDVSWSAYEKLLEAVGNRAIRLTYDRGTLEIMAPLFNHEWWKGRLHALIIAYGSVLGVVAQGTGSTTFRRRRNERGLEPDDSFYIRNAEILRGRRELDLERDPPPDLAFEVDITNSSLDRMEIYAVLAVPEVWRMENEEIRFYHLRAGVYVQAATSLNLPLLTPRLVHEFIESSADLLDTELPRFAARWVRKHLGSSRTGSKPPSKGKPKKDRRPPKDSEKGSD